MLTVLRRRDFALLWLAGLVSQVGDWLLLIALPYHVHALTGSALATGAAFMAYELPRIALSSVAGVLVDRYDRRRLLVVANLLSALVILPLLLLVSADWLWLLYAVVFLQSCCAWVIGPATGALAPLLVDAEELPAANALDGFTGGASRLLGPLLGGVVAAAFGFGAAVALDAASFLAAAALALLIRSRPAAPATDEGAPGVLAGRVARLRRDWSDGLRVVAASPLLRAVFAAHAPVMVAYGATTVSLVLFVREVLGGGTVEFGWIATAQGVGTLLGAACASRLARRVPPPRLLPLGLAGMALSFGVVAAGGTLGTALGGFAAAGFSMMVWSVCQRTLIQQAAPNHYLGRVLGASTAASGLLILAGMGAASVGGAVVGMTAVLAAVALLQAAGAALAAVLFPAAAAAVRLDPVAAA